MSSPTSTSTVTFTARALGYALALWISTAAPVGAQGGPPAPAAGWLDRIALGLAQRRARAVEQLGQAQAYRRRADEVVAQGEAALRAAAGNAQAEAVARRAVSGAYQARERAEALRRAAENNLRRADMGLRAVRAADARNPRAHSLATSWTGDSRVFSKRLNRWLPMGDPALGVLEAGDRVRTGPDGAAELFLRDGESRVRLAPGTEMTLTAGGEDGNLLDLAAGKLRLAVKKLEKRMKKFEVRTPTAILAVRGTDFAVHLDGGRGTELRVFAGAVEFRPVGRAQPLVVNAGQRMAAAPDGTIAGPEPFEASAADAWGQE
jgi:hypothetical protein